MFSDLFWSLTTRLEILIIRFDFNPLSANPTKWLTTLKQFVGKNRRIVLSVFDHFVGLVFKGLKITFVLLTFEEAQK